MLNGLPLSTYCNISQVVIGASGDLAKKKTYPALFSLHCHKLLPPHTVFAGYARTAMSDEAFKEQISKSCAHRACWHVAQQMSWQVSEECGREHEV